MGDQEVAQGSYEGRQRSVHLPPWRELPTYYMNSHCASQCHYKSTLLYPQA